MVSLLYPFSGHIFRVISVRLRTTSASCFKLTLPCKADAFLTSGLQPCLLSIWSWLFPFYLLRRWTRGYHTKASFHTLPNISWRCSQPPWLCSKAIFNPNINQPILNTRITHTQGSDLSCVRASISDCNFLNWFRSTLILRKYKRGLCGKDNSTSGKVWVICFLFLCRNLGPNLGMRLPSPSIDSQATQGKVKDYK